MRNIEWTRKAVKQLGKIGTKKDRQNIKNGVGKLANWPNAQGDISNLQNLDGYRLRIGRYRIIFTDFETLQIIQIQEVKKRDENTY